MSLTISKDSMEITAEILAKASLREQLCQRSRPNQLNRVDDSSEFEVN
jgi:hypothetical protein